MEQNNDKSIKSPKNTNPNESHSLSGMYKDWFLEYASYVILDRAVPAFEDGLKPVQRRLLHALKLMDDGRFHKVANVIGQTMQFHPHGDASIYEALVNMGQKDLLIETQGNWGDVRTGDSAAAARYIEARLSKFALEVAFNPDNTEWQLSYDGRKKEPISLPMKFPILLTHGVEGIAVGLSTRILPHNFIEVIKESIKILKGQPANILPDFSTGGAIDTSDYRGGERGGKVRVRAKIEIADKKNLIITEIPYGTTTTSLIDSILKANDRGKIKIKKVVDNTAAQVEIIVELATGVSPDVTMDALYAFSDCEISISPSCCLIIEDKPVFTNVNELLRLSTEYTKELLRRELEIRLSQLLEKLHFASLEQIFIEKRIYRRIEECETFEAVIAAIDEGLKPYTQNFIRPVTEDDILRLTEIKIKRISKYDSFKANELIKELEKSIAQHRHDLENLTDYAIAYFNDLLKKYGKGRERRTEIRSFDVIAVKQVAVANQKLYINRQDGFIGYGLKKDEYIGDCSDIDDIIVFRRDGKFLVTPIQEKLFVGKDIIHAEVWRKGDSRKVYHAVYLDGKTGKSFVKRFSVTAITRDREYDITQGTPNSKLLYFSVQPNSEAERIKVLLTAGSTAKNKELEFDFGEIAVKGRDAMGNILTKYPIKKIQQVAIGASTVGGRKIWFDPIVGKLNNDGRGQLLGEFDTGETLITLHNDGSYILSEPEMTARYDSNKLISLEKWHPETIISAVYFHKQRSCYYVKRFRVETSTLNEPFNFLDGEGSQLVFASTAPNAAMEYQYQATEKNKVKKTEQLQLSSFVEVKGWKSLGNKLPIFKITSAKAIEIVGDETPQIQPTAKSQTPPPVKQQMEQTPPVSPSVEQEKDTPLRRGEVITWELNPEAGNSKKRKSQPKPKDQQNELF